MSRDTKDTSELIASGNHSGLESVFNEIDRNGDVDGVRRAHAERLRWLRTQTSSMAGAMITEDLNQLDALRRKAQWMLADLSPVDPGAVDALGILDEVERQASACNLLFDTDLSIEQLFEFVLSVQSRTGIAIVRDEDISRPWRQRFCVSVAGRRA